MDTSPKRERHPAEVHSGGRSTSPTESCHWWSGIYNPHYFTVQEIHERSHQPQTDTQKQQPSTTPRESRDISNKVDYEEWARYRHKKSFFTDLGGW